MSDDIDFKYGIIYEEKEGGINFPIEFTKVRDTADGEIFISKDGLITIEWGEIFISKDGLITIEWKDVPL